MASVAARACAPVAETARQAIGLRVAEVPCPGCGTACALLDTGERLLYEATRDGLGVPLRADDQDVATAGPADNVSVRCGRCNVTRHICGRAVFYRLDNGEPLLT